MDAIHDNNSPKKDKETTIMKNLLNLYKNWRISALTAMAIVAGVLILAESESLSTLAWTKLIGFGLAYCIYQLGRTWQAAGKLNELNDITE